jgi:peptidoglycan/xylan/chitin deacetylase (PgdA/CDA1 family)
MPSLRAVARTAFHLAGGLEWIRIRNRRRLRILMYHRFPDRSALERQLRYLRARYQPVPMSQVARWLAGESALPPNAVAITVDDGYRDFYDAAYPAFTSFGIPVTLFVITRFADGGHWLWGDKIAYACRHTKLDNVTIELAAGGVFRSDLSNSAKRDTAATTLKEKAKLVSEADRQELVDIVLRALSVNLPDQLPPEYQPISWDELRTLSQIVEIGCHTETHPILSTLPGEGELNREICGAKQRIESALGRKVEHFCYPNGRMTDIGSAAIEHVRSAGYRTAVTTVPGFADRSTGPFLLRRIGVDTSYTDAYFRQCVAGLRVGAE